VRIGAFTSARPMARFYQDTIENIRRWLNGQATG
jgi:hypothetical protein